MTEEEKKAAILAQCDAMWGWLQKIKEDVGWVERHIIKVKELLGAE